MRIQIKLFAVAAQLAENQSVTVDVPVNAKIAALRKELISQFPQLADVSSHLVFAVDGEYADEEATLTEGSEVACIPPVSGG